MVPDEGGTLAAGVLGFYSHTSQAVLFDDMLDIAVCYSVRIYIYIYDGTKEHSRQIGMMEINFTIRGISARQRDEV